MFQYLCFLNIVQKEVPVPHVEAMQPVPLERIHGRCAEQFVASAAPPPQDKIVDVTQPVLQERVLERFGCKLRRSLCRQSLGGRERHP